MCKYFLKGCHPIKNLIYFEFKTQALENVDINNQTSIFQRDDLVMFSPKLEDQEQAKIAYIFGIVDTYKDGVLLLKSIIDQTRVQNEIYE